MDRISKRMNLITFAIANDDILIEMKDGSCSLSHLVSILGKCVKVMSTEKLSPTRNRRTFRLSRFKSNLLFINDPNSISHWKSRERKVAFSLTPKRKYSNLDVMPQSAFCCSSQSFELWHLNLFEIISGAFVSDFPRRLRILFQTSALHLLDERSRQHSEWNVCSDDLSKKLSGTAEKAFASFEIKLREREGAKTLFSYQNIQHACSWGERK